jgi:hypothetical protein
VKKFLIVISAILIVVVIAALAILGGAGYFTTVTVGEKEAGPFTLVYEEYRGPYSEVGPVMERIYRSLEADGVVPARGFGIYFDDPRTVKKEDLRSEVGFILEGKNLERLPALSKKYKAKKIAKDVFYSAEFPYRNKMSYIVGPMKVYPAFEEYLKERAIKHSSKEGYALEIYDEAAKTITFLMPKIQ